jgi:hypothetical protein
MPQDSPPDRNWTAAQVAAIVADYREMLAEELRGESFNKRARNTALQKIIGRSQGSIEFKHQNISAVLNDLGLRFIQGYKPAINYQQLLADEVLAWLIAAPAEAALLAQPAPISTQIEDMPSFEVGAAPIENAKVRRSTVAKIDFAARDAANRELGRLGEEYVFEFERKRLHDAGSSDLSRQVRWVSQEDGDGAGYDIASRELDGRPKLIEVKTTTGTAVTPFFITANEVAVSTERAEHYHLFRLHSFPKTPTIRILRPPIAEVAVLTPVAFRAQII